MPRPTLKIDFPAVRKRARKGLKAKFNKTVSLSKINSVWKDYVELKVIPELIENGEVRLDNNTTIRIEGTKIEKSQHASQLKTCGLTYYKGRLREPNIHKGRPGIIYKIVIDDTLFREGKLIFHAHDKIRKNVHEALKNTNRYYHVNQ